MKIIKGKKIKQDEIDLAWDTYSGCFMPYRGGEKEMNEILESNITHWANYKPPREKVRGYCKYI